MIGIGTLTVSYEEVADQVVSFYQSYTPDLQRQEILKRWSVDYVYWGPHERELGDWLRIDALYIESSLLDIFSHMVDETALALEQIKLKVVVTGNNQQMINYVFSSNPVVQ